MKTQHYTIHKKINVTTLKWEALNNHFVSPPYIIKLMVEKNA